MRVLGKFVVCLALLLAAELARPLPALAVWGDNNEPMPVLFGLTLGGDIREHPELEQQYRSGWFDFPENWSKGATYEGISVHPRYYNTVEYKISSVVFSIKVKDFPRFRKLMRRKFGNEILRDEAYYPYEPFSGYYWGKYEVEIWAPYPFKEDMVNIVFFYLPLYNQDSVAFHDNPDRFSYHGVTLNRKVEKYPFLHPVKEEAPDIVYYQSDEPPLVFDGYKTRVVESETWLAYKGVIYSLELRGEESGIHLMGRKFKDIFGPEIAGEAIMYDSPEVRLGDYVLYFKPGLTVMTHMPTYWRMLRAKTKLGK